MRKGREMRVFRVLVVGALMAGGLVLLAPGASGSAPAVSKACKSLKSLDKKLNKVIAGGESGNYDSGAINDVSKSFKNAAKTGPKSLRSAMRTIASVASAAAAAGNPTAAAAALKKGGQTLAAAAVTWGRYLATNCAGSSSSSS